MEKEKTFEIVVVGAGGIGTHLMPMLIRSLMPSNPFCVRFIVIDGDIYEKKNLARQQFTRLAIGRNKAEVQVEKIKRLMEGVPAINDRVVAFPQYLTPDNLPYALSESSKENLIIFSGVDNHPCRLLLSRFVDSIKENNVLLFTGGNNEMDGTVHLQGQWEGHVFDKPIEERHPEILTDTTDDRSKMSCQELHNLQGGEQTIAANAMAAAIMFGWFVSIMYDPTKTTDIEDVYYDLRTMNIRAIRPVVTLKKGKK